LSAVCTLTNLAGICSPGQPIVRGQVEAMLAAMSPGHGGRRRWQRGSAVLVGEEECRAAGEGSDAPLAPVEAPAGSLLVALDGHIENALELGAELGTRPEDPCGLVRACFKAWGDDFVARLQGAFALVIIDAETGLVRLARDPLGVRPLYWARAGADTLAFASLPCALTTLSGVGFEPDLAAIRRELLGMPTLAPATCYRKISMVPRGTLLRFERLEPSTRTYWTPRAPPADGMGEAQWVERYRDAFRRSTEGKLRDAPRPVGVTLSGGIDSSCVLGMARSLVGDASELVAVTAVFAGKASADEQFAADVARHCGVSWQRFAPLGVALPDRNRRLASDPFLAAPGDPGLETASVARDAGCRIVLTGSLGDFVGGSLPGWRTTLLQQGGPSRLWQELSSDARLTRARRVRTLLGSVLSYGAAVGWLPQSLVSVCRERKQDQRRALELLVASPAEKRALAEEAQDYWRLWNRPQTDIAALARVYMDSASDRELRWLDLVSRTSGVEHRAPLADPALMDISVGLPWGLRRSRGLGRIVLRESVQALVPEALRLRADKLVASDWFGRLYQDVVHKSLEHPPGNMDEYFDVAGWRRQAERSEKLSFGELCLLYETLVVARWLEGQVAPAGPRS
jgi:asparagine synthase (glutamine-hydrolysing)